jgi:hypothetical protein
MRTWRCFGAMAPHSMAWRAPRPDLPASVAAPDGRAGGRYARRVLSSGRASLRSRAAACFACALLALLLAGPGAQNAGAASLGGSGALGELTEGQTETTTAPTTTTRTGTSTSEPTNSHTIILVATGAAVLLLVAIAFVIVRDARRVAPAGDPELVERSSAHETAIRLQKRRAKAKAARRQRRRNR